MKRKLIASLLCLCMLVSLLPVAAFATDTETQPEGLESYKVIAAGVNTTLPGGFPTTNAGSAASDTSSSNRIYVQLNKPVPEGYTIALTVYPDGKTEGAYLSTYVAGSGPEGICVTVQKLNTWYWGEGTDNANKTDFSAFGSPEKLSFHVSIVPYKDGEIPAYTDDGTGHYVFTPVNSITLESGKTASETISVPIATPISNPVIWAGLSADAAGMITDIKAATGMTATADGEDAENLLWFAMKGLDAGKYTLSMKGSSEVLNNNSIAYGSDGKFTVESSGKHLIYVSLDEFSDDGATGQGSLTALGNGGTFTVSVTKESETGAAAASTIELVKVTLVPGDDVTLPADTKTELYAEKGDKITLPIASKAGQEFQGWAVDTETPVKGEYTANASVTLKPVFGDPVVKTPELSHAGFDMDASKACTAINAALEAVRPGGSVPSSDVDTNTMFVAANNLDSTKTYELAVTNKAGKEIYAEKALTDKTETVVYFTFNSNGGSHTSDPIAADTYSFQLYEMVTAEGTSTATRKAVGDPVSLELVKATLKAEDATTTFDPVDLYAAKGGKVTLTAEPVRTGYTFKGWNDGTQTVAKGGELTLTDSVNLTAVWQSDAVTTAEADVKADAITDSTAKAALEKTTAVSDNLMLDPTVQEQAEAVAATITDDLLTDADKQAGTTVKAAVYLEVVPQEYTKASDDTAPVLKLEITPKVKLVKVSSDGQTVTDVAGKDAVALTSKTYAEPVTINVVLPADFGVAAGDQNVYAKHMNGTTVREYIKATVTAGTDDLTGNVIASFDATSFSPYELTVDNRKVTVTFGTGEGKELTPSDIGKKTTDLSIADPTPAEGKVFSGWGTGSTVIWAKDTALTAEILDKLIEGATDNDGTKEITLTAIFTDASTPPQGGTSSGSSGGVSSNVTIDRPTNGKVTVTPTAPSKGATVTINLTPDAGYQVGTVTVTDKDGNAVELTKVSDTQYTFTMPDGKVTVKATFTQVETPSSTGFTDVAADAYYADAVKWAVENGITNGLTATTFGPNNSCTRGQMVTFLWRAAGSPAAAATNSFTDVASGEYYYDAVLWAVEKGITNGTSDTTFSPNATVNRGQTVTFLYRYAGSPAATGTSSFTDVTDGAFYADAVKWAVAEEITNGTSATTFSPNSNCTRGQIVTFMYRQMAE